MDLEGEKITKIYLHSASLKIGLMYIIRVITSYKKVWLTQMLHFLILLDKNITDSPRTIVEVSV